MENRKRNVQIINGTYMSMAQSVTDRIFNLPRRKIAEIDLLNNSLGFSMCDLLFSYKCPPKIIMDSINRYYIKSIGGDTSIASDGIKYFGNSIPNYLSALIKPKRRQSQLV